MLVGEQKENGAWGDPETGLAVAMVLNQIGGTPFGDLRFARVGAVALKAARQRDGISRRGRR